MKICIEIKKDIYISDITTYAVNHTKQLQRREL